MDLKGNLLNELKKNEHTIQVVALEDLNQEYQKIKDTLKTASGYIAPATDARSAIKIISELGMSTNKVVVKSYTGKQYVIFKGYPGNRKILTGTRYLMSNPKVIRMAIGPKGIVKSVKGGFIVTVILSVGIEVFDYFIRDSSALHELLGTVSADLTKIGLSSIAAAVAGMAVGASTILGSVAAAPLVAAIGVGIATGVLLNAIDEKHGATKALIKAYEQMGINLEKIADGYNRGMNAIDKNPLLVRCLFGPCDQNY